MVNSVEPSGLKGEQTSLTPKHLERPSVLPTRTRGAVVLGWGLIVLLFVGFGGWASLAPLNSASVSMGEVFVVTNNRVVEHLEGGLVSRIWVKEGDEVVEGQNLLSLSEVKVVSELETLEAKWIEAWGQVARLRAERDGLEHVIFSFPEKVMEVSRPAWFDQVQKDQLAIFLARKQALSSEVTVLIEQAKAVSLQVVGLEATNRALKSQVLSYQSDIDDFETLVKRQLTDKTRMHEMQREMIDLQGQYERNRAEILRLNQTASNMHVQAKWVRDQFYQNVLDDLHAVQMQYRELTSRLSVLRDQMQRMNLTAPVSGKVKGLSIYSVGEVISGGEALMEIVPKSSAFAIKSRVVITDINEVRVGLNAQVRFSAFNTQTTHMIEGEVVHLSADRFVDSTTGQAYFEAQVVLTEAGLAKMEQQGLFLLPGMPAEVMIQTGERTLFSYILKPFTDRLARAFNET